MTTFQFKLISAIFLSPGYSFLLTFSLVLFMFITAFLKNDFHSWLFLFSMCIFVIIDAIAM